MEVENAPGLERTFEYCYIQWKIKDALFVGSYEEYMLRSADFTVNHPQMTKWRLILKSYRPVDDENSLSVLLERLESDTGPRTVWVSWRVALLNKKDVEHCHFECESYFEKNYSSELDLISFPEVLKICDGTMIITFQMIVDHNHDAKMLRDLDSIHIGTKTLSEDLRRICNKNTFYDTVLKIDDKCFRAHRSILAARNTVMCEYVGNARIVELSELDTEAMDRVLRYLYTGNLLYIFVNPTIALYLCLEFFEMPELIAYFSKQKLVMVTKLRTTSNYTVNWAIRDIIYGNENYIQSLKMRITNDEVWRLHLYTKGVEGNSTGMDLFIEYVTGSKPVNVRVEIAVLDFYKRRFREASKYGYIKVSGRLGVTNFLARRLLPDVLRGDALHLVVTIQQFLDEHVSTIVSRKQEPCPPVIPYGLYYAGLSINMKQLYYARAYADFTLIAEGRRFPAHRCILAARSRMFSRMLRDPNRNVLQLEVNADTLKMVLKYIYMGHVKMRDIHQLKRLYTAALIYGIPSLKTDCSQSLTDLLDQYTVVDILVFADDNRDGTLKSAALEFIWTSLQNQEINEQIWENLVNDRLALYQDILDYIALRELETSNNSNS